ncbi:hypothetical protein CW751_06635 [Brumimicrobium salinarum]|uniref:Carboxypeptidase regulatory-like domain-containing protein n=1 Tax=Brumimicrobium salinarum TaxID=2058658 RepID=A0A2I0R3U4_9FLAO|nr:hypothetical protein [Brumimicrobium salinarum]PKR81255.1 hypothetical protein CW751_06635 [Brumimicrobium salinarum]
MKYLLIISLLLFVSCKKKQTIHITATNAATGEPYPGLTYYVVTYTNINGGTKSKTVATGALDANGEAVVTERLSKNKGHGVRVVEPENSCYNKNIQLYFSEEDGENFKAEFEFAECAYMQQNIQNVNCEGANDVFVIRDRYTYTEWTGWSIDLEGCFSNVAGGYAEVPAGTRYFEWKVTRPSGVTTGVDTVILVPGQNTDLSIFY